jgi:hypothetical protein
MNTKFIYDTFSVVQQNKIMLVYQGEFTQEIAKSVLAMTERNLDNFNEDQTTKRKIFNVMVECLQNICKHSENSVPELKEAIFMIGLDNDYYFITTGNHIANENVIGLKTKLEEINTLDKDGLKQLHKSIVSGSQALSDKGGAGLGLIDVARKSGEKLIFDFTPAQNDTSFYSLLIKISKNKINA